MVISESETSISLFGRFLGYFHFKNPSSRVQIYRSLETIDVTPHQQDVPTIQSQPGGNRVCETEMGLEECVDTRKPALQLKRC